MTESARFDVLGLGCVAVDDLLYVNGYPPADSKTPVLRRERQGGGLTGTALVAAARFGTACQYAGCLGNDELSNFSRGRMCEEGIGLEHAKCDENVQPVHSVIVVDEGSHTRTIFFDADGAARAADDWPPDQVIRAARVLFVDFFGIPGMIPRRAHCPGGRNSDRGRFRTTARPSRLCRVVCAGEPSDPAAGFRAAGPAARTLTTFCAHFWSPERQAAVVTCGVEGCWYLGAGDPGPPRHQPAFPVTVVDTTGCGDVFHGVYAATLAQGFDLPTRIRWAAAAAALKATARGGQTGIPKRAAVEQFLMKQQS